MEEEGGGVNDNIIYLFGCFCNFYFKSIRCNTVNELKYVDLYFCGLFLKVIFVGSEISKFPKQNKNCVIYFISAVLW